MEKWARVGKIIFYGGVVGGLSDVSKEVWYVTFSSEETLD